MTKRKVIITVSLVVVLAVLLFLGVSLKGAPKDNIQQQEYKKVSHSGSGQWYGNERGVCQNFDKYDEQSVLIENSGNKLYDLKNNKIESLCRKSNCLHGDVDCIQGKYLSYQNADKGEVVALDSDSSVDILRISGDHVEVLYRAQSSVRGTFCYNDWVYYMTDYEIRRFNIDDTSTEEVIINRPIFATYLYFVSDKMVYVDENFGMYMANLDGSDEEALCDDQVCMLEINEKDIYYLKQADRCLYAKSTDSLDERKLIDTPIWRYLVCGDYLYYKTAAEKDVLHCQKANNEDVLVDTGVEELLWVEDNYLLYDKGENELFLYDDTKKEVLAIEK